MGAGKRELFNSAPGENPSQFLCGWIMGYKCASVRACIMQERACVCMAFFCTQMDGVCMSTANSHACLFFHRLAFYAWRASCLPVHLCVCVCLLDAWCDK